MKTDDPRAIPATCATEALCRVCGKPVRKNDKCFWIKNEGLIHPDCLELLESVEETA